MSDASHIQPGAAQHFQKWYSFMIIIAVCVCVCVCVEGNTSSAASYSTPAAHD